MNVPRLEKLRLGPPTPGSDSSASSSHAQVQLLRGPRDRALARQQQLPRVQPHQVARPQRQHHRDVQQRLLRAARMARHVVRERKAEHGAGQRDAHRHRDRAPRGVDVGAFGERDEVLQREFAHHLAGEVVETEERIGQQREQRAEVDHAEPQQRAARATPATAGRAACTADPMHAGAGRAAVAAAPARRSCTLGAARRPPRGNAAFGRPRGVMPSPASGCTACASQCRCTASPTPQRGGAVGQIGLQQRCRRPARARA